MDLLLDWLLNNVNMVTVALWAAFLIPVIIGAASYFSWYRVQTSIFSLFENVEFIAALLLSIFLTRKVFFEHSSGIYERIYQLFPPQILDIILRKDILTYLAVVPLLLLVIVLIFRLITMPLYKKLVLPLCNSIYNALLTFKLPVRRLVSALWQLPRAAFTVIVVTLLLSGYAAFSSSALLNRWMDESSIYQTINGRVLKPVFDSKIAKSLPVLFNDYFRDTVGSLGAQDGNANPGSLAGNISKQLTGGNVRVVEYFNGVTLEEAIKSNADIDRLALSITGNETNSKKKAYLIYKWICSNIKYDYEKAENVSKDPRGIESGSIVAFNSRKGICFDYSCLYVSMCRAAGLKVRLVTGLGYSGVSWGDHAWNQVYSNEEQRWINVDTTFGTVGNYFDKPDFSADHKYDDIQGEWQ